MRTIDEDWAAFWCGLLHPLNDSELSGKELSRLLEELSQKEHLTPAGKRRRYSVSTLRRKLRRFKEERLKGLLRRRRSDRGKSRVITAEQLAALVEMKRELPTRSEDTLSRMLKARLDVAIGRSTLYRHLKAAGATRLKLGVTRKPVRCRWTREHSNDLWIGDFQEGPFVLHNGEILQTHLSAFIDCHSRFIVAGRYYLSQKLAVLEDTLLRAFTIHGSPHEILLDNAKVYHAKGYALLCGELGIKRRYRKPYEPESGGLIERFFRTSQEQFEAEVRAGRTPTLDDLNRDFGAWVDIVYHARKHSETQEAPLDRYKKGLGILRKVDTTSIHAFFMRRETRKVDPTYSDIRLDGLLYRVDARLRGDRVQVAMDPFGDRESVLILSHEGEHLGEGRLHRRELREDMPSPPPGVARSSYLKVLREEQDHRLAERVKDIDYRQLRAAPKRWPFVQFATQVARALRLTGGLSSFNAGDLETLKKFWIPRTSLSPDLVTRAAQETKAPNLSKLLFQIKNLIS
ncbi:MAG: DDE-type integrase/transposase/recombinase [Planctomycetes bacterium]|nr:DDE-type integrase/transposase/recombinase [Planctomycetota bacterium]